MQRLFKRRPLPGGASARRGFTLIEVVMATFVMAVGISASIVSLQFGFKALDNARNTTLASQIIQSEMERVRLLNWTAVSALNERSQLDVSALFPADDVTADQIESRFSAVRATADVADRAGEMKEITVTVTWKGIDGVIHTRTTSTRYAKDGLNDYYYRIAGS